MENSRMEELRNMSYDEYLQTPEWIEKRDIALQRAEYRCQICNSPNALNVHHRTYENRGNERLQDLTVLCSTCHELYHHKDLIGNHILSIESSLVSARKCIETPAYLSTGFVTLDKLLNGGLQKGELIIVGGVPGSGKSAFSTNVLLHAAHNKAKCLFFSLEMNHIQLNHRMLSMVARIPLGDIRQGQIDPGTRKRLSKASDLLKGSPISIDDTPSLTVQQIKHRSLKFNDEYDLDLIVIDYFQLIENDASVTTYNINYFISGMVRALKGLARSINVAVILISRLNNIKAIEKRTDKRPILADFEVESIAGDADIVFLLCRPEIHNIEGSEGLVEVIIAKNRNGAEATEQFAFVGEFLRFEELELTTSKGDNEVF